MYSSYKQRGFENGALCTYDKALQFKIRQWSFIESALSEGLQSFNNYLRSNLQRSCFYSELLDSATKWFYKPFVILGNPDQFYHDTIQLMRSIYKKYDSNDKQALFYEFLVGLLRFAASIELSAYYLLKQQNIETMLPKLEPANFWEWLRKVSVSGSRIIDTLIIKNKYNDYRAQTFWSDVQLFFSKHPEAQILAKRLTAIHYVPSDSFKYLLALAQSLHWNGLGGDGQLLEAFEELAPLRPHALGYHQHRSTQAGFNKRLEPFKRQLNALSTDSNEILLKYVFFMRRQDAIYNDDPLKIIDFSSGPSFCAVKQACQALKEHNIDFELSVTEVDGYCLEQLANAEKEYNYLKHVYYVDLTQSLPSFNQSFHYISASLALHQLPQEQITYALRFFVKIAKPNAMIVIADVGEQNYYQALVAPANLVDREGYFSDVFKAFDFAKVAIDSQTSEEELYIPYPLTEIYAGYPELKQSMYSLTSFSVSIIPKAQLRKLQHLWDTQQFHKANQLISQYNSPIYALQARLRSSVIEWS